MKTEPFASEIFKNIPTVMTIGVFDGMHVGHMRIIEECVRTAQDLNAKSVVVTFSINPKMYCGTEEKMKSICSDNEVESILANAGVNYHCVIDFSHNISKLTGEEFVAKVCTSYDLKAMVVGTDFRCGCKNGSAGVAEISQLLPKYTSSAFLKVVDSVFINGEKVSSSLIRRCLLTGNTEKASVLLGRSLNLGLSQNDC